MNSISLELLETGRLLRLVERLIWQPSIDRRYEVCCHCGVFRGDEHMPNCRAKQVLEDSSLNSAEVRYVLSPRQLVQKEE